MMIKTINSYEENVSFYKDEEVRLPY